MELSAKLLDLAVLLAAFWGLLKWTISRELKNIYATIDREFRGVNQTLKRVEDQGNANTSELRDMHGRVSVLEATRPGVNRSNLGRRKGDRCSAQDCPFEVDSTDGD